MEHHLAALQAGAQSFAHIYFETEFWEGELCKEIFPKAVANVFGRSDITSPQKPACTFHDTPSCDFSGHIRAV
jgi:hypothetical protein